MAGGPLGPARSGARYPLAQARVATTVITPIAPHRASTLAPLCVLWLMLFLVIGLHNRKKAVLGGFNRLPTPRLDEPGRQEHDPKCPRQRHDGIHNHWLPP